MKYLCILLLLTCGVAIPAVHAAESNHNALRDSVLQKLASKKEQQHFRFTQEKKLAILQKPLLTSGELLIGSDQTVTWDIRQPYQLRYILTADSIREIDSQGERSLQIAQNPVAAALTQAMTATFSGNWQANAALADVAASGSEENWELHITPKAEALKPLVSSIAVQGSAMRDNKILVSRIVIHETNGDLTTIQLTPFAQ